MTTPLPRIDPNEPRDWFFTFGYDHHHPTTGQPLRKSYVRIHGTCDGTREAMVAAFGRGWSMQYYDRERAGVDRYGLTEVALPGAPEPDDADRPTVAADVAAIKQMVEQLRINEREHGRQPSGDLWDAAEATAAEISDRLDRIERLATAGAR